MRARDRARQRDVILVIDHYVPEPDRDAGSRTMLCIIRGLLQTGMVVKFWPHNLHFSPGYTEALQDIGVEVAYGGDAGTFRQWLADNGDDLDHRTAVPPAGGCGVPARAEATRRDQPALLRRRSAFQPNAPGGEATG